MEQELKYLLQAVDGKGNLVRDSLVDQINQDGPFFTRVAIQTGYIISVSALSPGRSGSVLCGEYRVVEVKIPLEVPRGDDKGPRFVRPLDYPVLKVKKVP